LQFTSRRNRLLQSVPKNMTHPPSISVALCTYNGARFVAEQIQSIFDQTLPPNQIVISDDGSSDETLAAAQEAIAHAITNNADLASVDIVFFENARPLGVTKNFQQALEACSGELVALSDQDDVWVVNKLEVMVNAMDSEPNAGLAFSDARLVGADGSDLGASLLDTLRVSALTIKRINQGDAFDVLAKRNIVTGATVIVRKSLLQRALPFPASWVHDEWLAMVASMLGKVIYVPEELIQYRQHSANVIGAKKLSVGSALGRFGQSRAERNSRLVARARDACEFSETLFGNESLVVQLQDKLRHEEVRSSYPARRWQRILPIISEWRTGRYVSFGLGLPDILRDAVQPE
jgi:glycosyltransferase involved in cell wall biosynthesis